MSHREESLMNEKTKVNVNPVPDGWEQNASEKRKEIRDPLPLPTSDMDRVIFPNLELYTCENANPFLRHSLNG